MAVCDRHLSPGTAIVFSLLSSVQQLLGGLRGEWEWKGGGGGGGGGELSPPGGMIKNKHTCRGRIFFEKQR